MKQKEISEIRQKKNRISRNHIVVSVTEVKYKKIPINEPIILQIAEIADSLGLKLYIVGGYVRDHFLNRPRTDFDFTVIGDSIAFAKKVAKQFKSKAVIFENFRTAMVPVGDFKFEFVGTRKEVYTPESRKPKVSEGTLEDDLMRRDFTVNAMAASLNQDTFGNLIDLFNGEMDLHLSVLKTPLEPGTTFSDDPLRMMRSARFAAQLGFSLDHLCVEAAKKISERISIISQERITDEFLKIINSPKPSVGIELLYDMGLLNYIFPELVQLVGIETVVEQGREFQHKDVFRHSLKVLDKLAEISDNTWLRFAALIHDVAKSITKQFIPGTGWSFHGHEELGARRVDKIFRRMKLPLDKIEYVEKLVRLHQRPMVLVSDGVTDSAVRRLAVQAGEELEDLFRLCICDITTNNPKLSQRYLNNYEKVKKKVMDVQEKDRLREFQSPVRGEEIMEICNIKPSRAVGYIKTQIEEAILDGIIPNEYEEAKQYFTENYKKWLEEAENEGFL